MCFSAEVSFAASAVLTVSGVVAVKKAISKEWLLFACIPFIFAAQQLMEGILWLSYTHAEFERLRQACVIGFLVFAQVIWPVWVPLSMLSLEKIPSRKTILKFILAAGAMLSAYVAVCLFIFPVDGYPQSHHIKYELGFPLAHSLIAAAFYFTATVISCVVSSAKRMTTLGLIILGSYILAKIFFSEYSISVWCFFAAIISVMVIYVVHLAKPASSGSTKRSTHAMEG
jgi:hypothetical protein